MPQLAKGQCSPSGNFEDFDLALAPNPRELKWFNLICHNGLRRNAKVAELATRAHLLLPVTGGPGPNAMQAGHRIYGRSTTC